MRTINASEKLADNTIFLLSLFIKYTNFIFDKCVPLIGETFYLIVMKAPSIFLLRQKSPRTEGT
ncbi:hypothetical protein QNH39_26175 [Neobacillus novalis]|uniref:Uncharacterized protein n=1 Tax=Neobacillus novalis TaxID=220687 RepID=A0AA95MQG1_9BACI|nr:hypothetical protein [Neobacillus novalis]WHY86020.1 hypothetical protein QNH39_26175 [Neobacillus novalis]